MKTAEVHGKKVNVWPTWKRIDEYNVTIVGACTVESFTIMAASEDAALEKAKGHVA